MLDVFAWLLALYFVDVIGANNTQASVAVTVWLGVGLLGDFCPLLERLRGLDYLRFSAIIVLCLYPTFLMVSNVNVKLVILGFLGFFNWVGTPSSRATVYCDARTEWNSHDANNVSGLVGGFMPLALDCGSTVWVAKPVTCSPVVSC